METAFEQILISAYKVGMIAYLESHPEDFEEAINLAISDKQPYAWRSASLLWSCMEENDKRIRKYLVKIINYLPKCKDGHQRELLKIMFNMHLNEKYECILFDFCMTVWERINSNPSVRHTAFRFIIKMAKKHPDLFQDIGFLTQDHYLATLSPGVKNSIFKMIEEYS